MVAVARLLLPDNPLPVRGQAAGCLLQYISICKADARQRTAPVLLASISKALGPIKFQLATGDQRLYRFVSTCLRILAVLVSQTLLNDEDQCRTLVGVVAAWVFTGTQARSGLASPAPNKSRIPSTTPGASQLSFGVMSAFAQQSPQKRTPRPRQNSDASTSARSISLASSRGGSENRLSDSESETESEAGQPWDRQQVARYSVLFFSTGRLMPLSFLQTSCCPASSRRARSSANSRNGKRLFCGRGLVASLTDQSPSPT